MVVQVHRQHTHADGFHDVFVEILQALVGQRLLLQRGIEPGILNGDSDVTSERFQ